MRSAPADPARPARGAVTWACLVLTSVLLLTGCTHEVSIKPPAPPRDDVASRADAAQSALDELEHALDSGGQVPSGLVAPGAPKLLDQVVDNARRLGARDLSLSYVDANLGALDASDRARFGSAAWAASVQVGYRLAVDTGATHMEVAFTFVPRSHGVAIAAIGGHGERSPLWLRGAVRIVRSGRSTVIDAGRTGPAHYLALARHAVRDVNLVLPHWRGRLTVEVPATESELDSVLNADPSTYANIAAVTTTVDGSLVRGSPVHVFLNPAVFETLRTKGAQVVLSHETTHVATGGPFADMPTWLLEGFADYVALDHAGVPVQKAAGQILARIRKHGLPTTLPTTAELDPTATGLGATYEEAWLACRYLAATYGEPALITFYRAVDRGRSVGGAFRSVLGTSEPAFVTGWRRDLARLAG